MKPSFRWVLRFVLIGTVLLAAFPAYATIDYTVSIAHPDSHIIGVTMKVPAVRERLIVQMPAWNALYQIRDFSSHMMQLNAFDDAKRPLSVVKLDKQTWSVSGSGDLTLTYPMYWDEAGPFATQLNQDHAFLNLAMLLLYVPDRRTEDTRLSFSGVPENWRVAVELDPAGMSAGSRTEAYEAPGYDSLVDAPVEIGTFDEFAIQAGGRPIRIVVHGDAGERTRLTDALKRIVDYDVALMGGAPFREYMFLFHVGPNFGGGGMEHSNSTAIAADAAAQLSSYSAHEFFHTWNVKRIRPQTLEPVDYTKEMWTRSLWFAEGVTSTYGAYALVRTGLWSTQQFYGNLAAQINELESRPAHRWQSVEQASLDAWYEKYPIYVRPEESISYYDKGQIDGVMLDIEIRDRTENRASLDDVMRTLNVEFAQRGRFYNDSEDVRAVAEGVIRRTGFGANADLEDFFLRYVSGTDEIPFSSILGRAGLGIRDTGQRRAAFGFIIVRDMSGAPVIESVDANSEAQQDGLRKGDILLSLNGEAVPKVPERWLRDRHPDERVSVKVQRGQEVVELSLALARASEAIYQISELPDASAKQRRIRDGMLHGVTDSSK
jgi:predicted metalloprotease with PDZ domain